MRHRMWRLMCGRRIRTGSIYTVQTTGLTGVECRPVSIAFLPRIWWTDHGVAFDASTAIPWVSMTDLPAIDVAEKNGRWYYYFTVHSLLRERKFPLSARRPALSPLRSLKSVWMPPMVSASACVKSTIPEAGQTGRNISAEFQRFPPFFPGNVGRSGSLSFRCRRARSFRVQ